jgi:hypothetical protein
LTITDGCCSENGHVGTKRTRLDHGILNRFARSSIVWEKNPGIKAWLNEGEKVRVAPTFVEISSCMEIARRVDMQRPKEMIEALTLQLKNLTCESWLDIYSWCIKIIPTQVAIFHFARTITFL